MYMWWEGVCSGMSVKYGCTYVIDNLFASQAPVGCQRQ